MCIYVWGSVTVGVVHGEIPFFDKTLRINVVPIIGERVRESKRQGGFFTKILHGRTVVMAFIVSLQAQGNAGWQRKQKDAGFSIRTGSDYGKSIAFAPL